MKIDHICIVCNDLNISKNFYISIFKAEIVEEKEIGGDWLNSITGFYNTKARFVSLKIPFSKVKIELLHFLNPPTEKLECNLNNHGFRHIAIAVDNVMEIYKILKKLNINPYSEPISNTMGKVMFYFHGPDGEIWEIAEYADRNTDGNNVDRNAAEQGELNFHNETINSNVQIFNKNTANEDTVQIYTDGASRGNPGESGAGFIIFRNDKIIYEGKEYLGIMTNNQAEWNALNFALKKASELNIKKAEFYLDSELVVNQINGKYKIKNLDLQKLHIKCWNLKQNFNKITFSHIKREQNQEADRLANEAIDGS